MIQYKICQAHIRNISIFINQSQNCTYCNYLANLAIQLSLNIKIGKPNININLQHPSMAIVKGAGLVMRALVEEGGEGVGSRMQTLALAEAALPRHLLAALYAPPRLHHRHLARHLVSLWLVDHAPAHCLLKRIMVCIYITYVLLSMRNVTSPVYRES